MLIHNIARTLAIWADKPLRLTLVLCYSSQWQRGAYVRNNLYQISLPSIETTDQGLPLALVRRHPLRESAAAVVDLPHTTQGLIIP